jgi:type IV pilus assembly protein PilO
LAAGLEEKLFQPRGESRKDFYAELPISIRLTGGYHEMGKFASGIAALPRIVTLHDIEISSGGGRDRGAVGDPNALTLDLTAKTYRYLDEEERAQEQESAKAKKGRQKKPVNKG